VEINEALVRRLVAAQFPQWADMAVTAVQPGGWDNRTFRLGASLSVRLPSDVGYEGQVDKEHRWLPRLAARLPRPVPVPVARGLASNDYPLAWSVYPWLEGDTLLAAPVRQRAGLDRLADDLAEFLLALQSVPAWPGSGWGQHSAYRGGPVARWDGETRAALADVEAFVDAAAAYELWQAAVHAPAAADAVWFHGDVAAGNLLMRHGRLHAVIDFGCAGVGDPACDLAIAWTVLDIGSRERFRAALQVDDATWLRGRGWALWKALITLRDAGDRDVAATGEQQRVLAELLGGGIA